MGFEHKPSIAEDSFSLPLDFAIGLAYSPVNTSAGKSAQCIAWFASIPSIDSLFQTSYSHVNRGKQRKITADFLEVVRHLEQIDGCILFRPVADEYKLEGRRLACSQRSSAHKLTWTRTPCRVMYLCWSSIFPDFDLLKVQSLLLIADQVHAHACTRRLFLRELDVWKSLLRQSATTHSWDCKQVGLWQRYGWRWVMHWLMFAYCWSWLPF